jgi:hypothetical protein
MMKGFIRFLSWLPLQIAIYHITHFTPMNWQWWAITTAAMVPSAVIDWQKIKIKKGLEIFAKAGRSIDRDIPHPINDTCNLAFGITVGHLRRAAKIYWEDK